MTKPHDSRYRKVQLDRGRKVVEWFGAKFQPTAGTVFLKGDEVQLLDGSNVDTIYIGHSRGPTQVEKWANTGIVGGARNWGKTVDSWAKVGKLPTLEEARTREEKVRAVTHVPVDSVKVLEGILGMFPVRTLGSAVHVESCLDSELQAQFERALSRSSFKHQMLDDGTMLVWK
jgi:hypothetical protein